jgi:hypothetical protein
LEAKDESWARYFGLGRIETRPMELYDVRSLNNKLIGYSSYDPAKSRHPLVEVAVLDGREDRRWYLNRSEPVKRGLIKTIQVMTHLFAVEGERFVCWYVRIEDAEELARSNWLKCIGEDNLEEFIWNLRDKRHKEECERFGWKPC